MNTMPGQLALAWSPDGKMLATSHHHDIALRDAHTGNLLRTLTRSNPVLDPLRSLATRFLGIAFDKDGKRLAAWHGYYDASWTPGGAFFLWDMQAGKLLSERKEPGIGPPLALRPDGRQLATALRSDHNEVHLRDPDTGQITKTLKFPATKDHLGGAYREPSVRSLAYSPDGKILAMGIANGYVILWNSETGARLSQVHLGHHVGALGFDSAAGTLYAGDKGSSISILRADAKGQWSKVGSVNLGQDNEVSHLAIGPKSGRLLSASKDRVIRLWQVLRQAERAVELTPHSPYLVHTLGEAYYRVGEYRKALETLRRAIALRPKKDRQEGFWDLPFLAMIHHRLGQPDQARAYLKSLRGLAKQNRNSADEAQYRAFLAEAQELIEGKK
jgi:tetratricopeptide (TPR) repeat protein